MPECECGAAATWAVETGEVFTPACPRHLQDVLARVPRGVLFSIRGIGS